MRWVLSISCSSNGLLAIGVLLTGPSPTCHSRYWPNQTPASPDPLFKPFQANTRPLRDKLRTEHRIIVGFSGDDFHPYPVLLPLSSPPPIHKLSLFSPFFLRFRCSPDIWSTERLDSTDPPSVSIKWSLLLLVFESVVLCFP